MAALCTLLSCVGHTRDYPPTGVGHTRDYTPAGGAKCSQCPRHSDVVATSRTAHYDHKHVYDTWGAMQAFNATRMDWVYSINASFVSEAHARGLEVTLAMNPQCFDTGKSTTEVGRVLNIHGERLVAPWMRGWPNKRYYGCVNNPEYLKIAFDFASHLLETGSDGIQHDDPGSNFEATSWNQGDPSLSGCYCSHCMDGFTKHLLSNLSAPELSRLNVTASFNYKELLLREPWNGTSPIVKALRPLFVAYQQNVTEAYLHSLRDHIDEKASALGRTTSLSCNKGAGWQTLMACDYVLGELSASDATPEGLEAIFVILLPAGKSQVMTMPKSKNVSLVNSPAFEALIRTSIAYTYALGSNMVAPWDIYLPTPTADRYYGNASQYGDLFAFVRQHSELLDATTQPVPDPRSPAGEASRYYHNFTGGAPGKPGRRWRFPYPYTAPGYAGHIGGSRFTDQSLLTCEILCDSTSHCRGIYFYGGTCYTLNELVECQTTLRGDSYMKNLSAAPHNHSASSVPVANSSDENVRIKVRRSVDQSVAAVHIVDWRHALPSIWPTGVLPNITYPPFQLNVSNAILRHATACTDLEFVLHQLGPGRPPRVVKGPCAGNVTVLTLPSPVPWSLIEVRPAHEAEAHRKLPPSGCCHFSYAPQHSYSALNLAPEKVHTHSVWYVNGDGCGTTRSIEEFTTANESTIRAGLLSYFTTGMGAPINGGLQTKNVVIFDTESSHLQPGELGLNLKFLGEWLAAERANGSTTFQRLVDAYSMRARVLRSLMPNAQVGFYGSPNGPDA
jgi:hypothetical protein